MARLHNDLYNLFPAEGEINGDRKDYNLGMVSGARRDYGSCAFKIDASSRRENPFISQYAAKFGKTAPTTSSTATPKATVTVKCGTSPFKVARPSSRPLLSQMLL